EARMPRPDESHREQHEVRLELELRARNLLHPHAAVLAGDPLEADALDGRDLAVLADEPLGADREVALAAFLVARGGAQLQRPVGPGQRLVLAGSEERR